MKGKTRAGEKARWPPCTWGKWDFFSAFASHVEAMVRTNSSDLSKIPSISFCLLKHTHAFTEEHMDVLSQTSASHHCLCHELLPGQFSIPLSIGCLLFHCLFPSLCWLDFLPIPAMAHHTLSRKSDFCKKHTSFFLSSKKPPFRERGIVYYSRFSC